MDEDGAPQPPRDSGDDLIVPAGSRERVRFDHLEAIVSRLGLDDAGRAILEEEWPNPSPRWARRKARLDRRDRAIRHAMSTFYGGFSRRAAAFALARDLDAYLSSAWRLVSGRDALDGNASAKRRCLHVIARMNQGRSIGARQILNVVDGARGG